MLLLSYTGSGKLALTWAHLLPICVNSTVHRISQIIHERGQQYVGLNADCHCTDEDNPESTFGILHKSE